MRTPAIQRRTFTSMQGVLAGIPAGTYYIHFVTEGGARHNNQGRFSLTVTE